MGENPKYIFNHGCPAMDEIADLDLKIHKDFFSQTGGSGDEIDTSKQYIAVLQHPVTTEYEINTDAIEETIEAIKKLKMQTVWLWPNIDAGSDEISKRLRILKSQSKDFPLRLYRNFKIPDYARLLYNSACLVGNSSSGIRESAFLGVPSVNIGNRQIGRERGSNVIDVDNKSSDIFNAIQIQINTGKFERDFRFGKGDAGIKIAETLSKIKPEIQKKMGY